MTGYRQTWFEGWRLFALLALALTALCIWIAGMRGFEVEGVRMVIRFTARTSLLFFCLAFSAAALARLWPNAWTRWQRRNRRYLGVTFAASHGLHAGDRRLRGDGSGWPTRRRPRPPPIFSAASATPSSPR